MAALAVLSKTPALLLLPVSALLLLAPLWRGQGSVSDRLWRMFTQGAVWLGSFLLILLLLFPAIWSIPTEVLSIAGGSAGRHVEEALRPTFFMGDVAFDHGPLFYPVSLLWRLSPVILGGLFLLLPAFAQRRRFSGRSLSTLLLLLLWSLLFLGAITLAAKKFDRYLLPVIPALAIAAAIALSRPRANARPLWKGFLILLGAAELLMIAGALPYQLAAYNPLAGGSLTAQYVLPLGWGESISASGLWLAGLAGTETETAVSGIAPSLAPFFPGQTLFAENSGWQEADWTILTANSKQTDPEALLLAAERLELRHTVRYAFLDQAWIYRNPQPQPLIISVEPLAAPVSFGGQMRLLGQEIQLAEKELLYSARWQKETPAPLLTVKIELFDEAGRRWQSLETDLLNEVYFFPRDWLSTEMPQITYRLPLPAALPAGSYDIALSLVDQSAGGLLPLSSLGTEVGGVVYQAGSVQLAWPQGTAAAALPEMRQAQDLPWLDGALRWRGVVDLPLRVAAGGDIDLDLLWQPAAPLAAGLQVALLLGEQEPLILPLGVPDTADWPEGGLVRQKYAYPVPPDLPQGTYPLAIAPVDEAGRALIAAAAALGDVQVQGVDRLFALPAAIDLPLQVEFIAGVAPAVTLRGLSAPVLPAQAGETLSLTLYWQAAGRSEQPLTAFVHLLDENGAIVAQSDQWPGGFPSDLWGPDQVILDEHHLALPAELPPGSYTVAAGLYTAGDGRRLPAVGAAGERFRGDRFMMPLAVTVAE